MPVPSQLLDPSLWKGFNVDALYTLHGSGDLRATNPKSALSVYNPADQVPTWVFCRTSESTKRLEKGLSTKPAEQAVQGPTFGRLFSVMGGGSPIGVLVELMPDRFKSAHCTPDGIHLVNAQGELQDPIVKPVFSYKTFRSFMIGPADKVSAPHDLMLTAKSRWFRKRNNPKALGFSKDNKS